MRAISAALLIDFPTNKLYLLYARFIITLGKFELERREKMSATVEKFATGFRRRLFLNYHIRRVVILFGAAGAEVVLRVPTPNDRHALRPEHDLLWIKSRRRSRGSISEPWLGC